MLMTTLGAELRTTDILIPALNNSLMALDISGCSAHTAGLGCEHSVSSKFALRVAHDLQRQSISYTSIVGSAYGTVLRILSKRIPFTRNVSFEVVFQLLHFKLEIWLRARQLRSCWPASEVFADRLLLGKFPRLHRTLFLVAFSRSPSVSSCSVVCGLC